MEMYFKFTICTLLFTLLHFTSLTYAAQEIARKPKFIFDFIRPASNMALSKEISTNLPGIKNPNSPIYYIRMPPIPYSFIPGLGYVSSPQNGAHDLVNVPLPFLGNGRPVTIYQWSQVPLSPSPNLQNSNENVKDSLLHRLDGNFVFNGKPNKEIFLLGGNEYNSLYDDDVLNNVYP